MRGWTNSAADAEEIAGRSRHAVALDVPPSVRHGVSYVDFHRAGRPIARRGGAFGTLEANKFVGALRTPIRGTIVAVNTALRDDPRAVDEDPYGRGWFVVIAPSHLEEDLAALVHGDAEIERYVKEKIAEYRERGILPEETNTPALH